MQSQAPNLGDWICDPGACPASASQARAAQPAPRRKFGITADIPGRAVAVNFVHAYANVVNFEPGREMVSQGGIFWVKIHGGGMREGYLVELY